MNNTANTTTTLSLSDLTHAQENTLGILKAIVGPNYGGEFYLSVDGRDFDCDKVIDIDGNTVNVNLKVTSDRRFVASVGQIWFECQIHGVSPNSVNHFRRGAEMVAEKEAERILSATPTKMFEKIARQLAGDEVEITENGDSIYFDFEGCTAALNPSDNSEAVARLELFHQGTTQVGRLEIRHKRISQNALDHFKVVAAKIFSSGEAALEKKKAKATKNKKVA